MKRNVWLMGIGLALMTVPGFFYWYTDPDTYRHTQGPTWIKVVSVVGLALFVWGFPRKKD